MKVNCAHCGKEINRIASKTKNKRNIFCCHSCHSAFAREESLRNGTAVIVHCSHCGQEKVVQKSRYEKSKTKQFFCDSACQQAEQRIGGTLGTVCYGSSTRETCVNCGTKLVRYQKKYCSSTCQSEYRLKLKIENWLSGDWDSITVGDKRNISISKSIRKYLIDNANKTCSVCGTKKWLGKQVPLEIDHIDGDYRNNRPENLRVICLNCHGQTDTYRAKNIGKGRPYHKENHR